MLLFEEKEIEGYLSRLLQVHKSIYDAIEFESETEKRFAEVLDQREDIKLFIKLPRWFTVDTPIGSYNPDWAIVKQEDDGEEKLYLVTETKATRKKSSSSAQASGRRSNAAKRTSMRSMLNLNTL